MINGPSSQQTGEVEQETTVRGSLTPTATIRRGIESVCRLMAQQRHFPLNRR